GQVWVKALAEGEFLFLFGTAGLTSLGQFYAKRWTIEQCFQNLKERRFNLENSHLRSHDKLRKLVALVSLAYAFCLSVGQATDRRTPVAHGTNAP
ncbi:transposase, partial [Hymenobacter fastidiosus]|uniref:transposase n=1 Tax=Hymenobacter fastidiosus TaxID=486264 RepID=UPI0031EFA40D